MWLALAVLLLVVANGRWIVPLATWLAPIAWLVFVDRSRPATGLVTGVVAFVLVQFVVWWRIIPAPGILYFLIAALYGVVYFLPFVAHRLLAVRLPGLYATLVFPVAWVAVEFVFHRWGTPYGTWFSLAYTQAGQLPLLQLASITGTAGVSFVIVWVASLLAWTIAPQRAWRARWWAIGTAAASLVLVVGFGQLRLARHTWSNERVRVAGLVPTAALDRAFEAALVPVRRGELLSAEAMDTIRAVATRLNDDLLARTRREARAGARLVVWSETAGRVIETDEPAFLQQAGELARQETVDLVLAFGVWRPGSQPPFENKVVAISRDGEVAWHYHKAHPIIGAEAPFIAAGDRIVRAFDTGYGAVGAVICHDLDFPALVRQAARRELGLLVAPSSDWLDIAVLHADMAIPRAVENGFSLFRPTNGGRSIAVDSRGQRLAVVEDTQDAVVAYVPITPFRTVYGMIGDLFSWLCAAGLIVMVIVGARRSPGSS